MPRAPIALLTDFGWSGPFVGSMKAVILGINPDATVFDITHDIPPQAVEEGAFVLAAVLQFLPQGAICVAVVDPGVGTSRSAIAMRTAGRTLIGPDNGLLSAAIPDEYRAVNARPGEADTLLVPPGCKVIRLTNQRYFLESVSNTFHGRDVFAAVAAHASTGIPLAEFGDPIDAVRGFPPWRATATTNGCLAGRVVSVDRFGNLVTDVRAEDLTHGSVGVSIAGRLFEGLSRSYQDGPEFPVYIGSSGYLEIARRNASAAAALNVVAGEPVVVTKRRRAVPSYRRPPHG